MFINCINSIKADLQLHEELLERSSQRLKELKQYEGYYLTSSRGKYFYKTTTRNGSTSKKYLGTASNKAVREMKECRFLNLLSKECTRNISILKRCLEDYRPLTRESILRNAGAQYRGDLLLAGALIGERSSCEWLEKAKALKEECTPPHPEGLKHRTLDGSLVRTKSEVEYYNELLRRGYTFVYELPTVVNGRRVFPDFTVFNSDTGETIIIEHFGYMGGSNFYAEEAAKKIKDYIVDGWVHGENFLMLFETCDGIIDTDYIFREIERVMKKGRRG